MSPISVLSSDPSWNKRLVLFNNSICDMEYLLGPSGLISFPEYHWLRGDRRSTISNLNGARLVFNSHINATKFLPRLISLCCLALSLYCTGKCYCKNLRDCPVHWSTCGYFEKWTIWKASIWVSPRSSQLPMPWFPCELENVSHLQVEKLFNLSTMELPPSSVWISEDDCSIREIESVVRFLLLTVVLEGEGVPMAILKIYQSHEE